MLEAFKTKIIPESHIITIVGPGTAVNGRLTSTGSIRVEGRVSGLLQSEEQVMVLASGRVLADINARQIIISGEVEGDVTASERLEITRGAKVVGNISAPRVHIDEDVVFEGRCTMHSPAGFQKGSAGVAPSKKSSSEKPDQSSDALETSPGGFITRSKSQKATFDVSEEDELPFEEMEMLLSNPGVQSNSASRKQHNPQESSPTPHQEDLDMEPQDTPTDNSTNKPSPKTDTTEKSE